MTMQDLFASKPKPSCPVIRGWIEKKMPRACFRDAQDMAVRTAAVLGSVGRLGRAVMAGWVQENPWLRWEGLN